ncbi:uncharacterized protein A4U43_C01F16590 [Asparagus officinalis]|uniref:Uncharacterized protein n=1 Tax=Asparagus officinalis TaxID=4686 RepID=A0A5P1FQ42_ASPOF|nr:uncharacterized protein A4U43_C01F16590 [Asparagus officinalis]
MASQRGEAILFLDLYAYPLMFEGPKRDKQFSEDKCPMVNIFGGHFVDEEILRKNELQKMKGNFDPLRSASIYMTAKDSLSDSFFSSLLDHHDMEKKENVEKGEGAAESTETKEDVEPEITLRPLNMEDMRHAKNQVSASFATEGSVMSELRQWNDLYREGGSRKKEQMSYFL